MPHTQTIKQSFNNRAKRLGLQATVGKGTGSDPTISASDAEIERIKKSAHNKPFWIWNPDEHRAAHQKDKKACCFIHVLGLPRKYGKPHALYDYERQVLDAIEDIKTAKDTQHKAVYVLKASGLGLTTLMLYYMAYLALRNDELQGKNMAIVTGPRQELAIDLIRRMKALFPNVVFSSKETVVELNRCRIEAFPSHNARALRGLVDTVFVLADESAYWNAGQEEQEVRTVLERMIPKMNTTLILVSTPRAPGDLMAQIKEEPEDKCLYKRIHLPYSVGLGKIYTIEEIELAKRKLPSFEREFNLQFAAGFAGTFDQKALEECIKMGDEVNYNKLYQDDPDVIMGVDVGFGGGSSSAITICRIKRPPPRNDPVAWQQYEPIIEVVLNEVHSKPDFNELIARILWLVDHYAVKWCLIDRSTPEVIRALCLQTGQRIDYDQELKEFEKRMINLLDPQWPAQYWTNMTFYPIDFKNHRYLLQHTRRLIDSKLVAIPRVWDRLIKDLQTATDFDDVLKKDNTNPMDAVDSLRCALYYYQIDDKGTNYSQGGGDVTTGGDGQEGEYEIYRNENESTYIRYK